MPAKKIRINPEDFTLGELESLKDHGVSMTQIAEGDISAMVGLVWLHLRRTKPEATMEDARAVKLGQFELQGEPDPTTAS